MQTAGQWDNLIMVRKAIPAVLLLVSAAVMLALTYVPFDWSGWAPEACRLRNCYCEPFHAGSFVLQPITSLSNIGYVAAGCLVLAFVPRKVSSRNWLRRSPGYAVWYGAALILTGWFSFFSHASLSRVGEWFDLMGVYQLAALLIACNWKRLADIRIAVAMTFFVALMIVLGLQMAFIPGLQQVAIAVLLAAAAGLEVAIRVKKQAQEDNRLLLTTAVLFVLGALAWTLLGRAPQCTPGQFPWHDLWHLLSAAAACVYYFYYLSEQEVEG